MNWNEEWQALSARTLAIIEAGKYAIQVLGLKKEKDGFFIDITQGVTKQVAHDIQQLHSELQNFQKKHASELPESSNLSLHMYLLVFNQKNLNSPNDFAVALTKLILFRAEFEYLLRDTEIESRSRTERAFQHLQRLIDVDSDISAKWQSAFKHETHSERLGGVHLLSHGIWAFKLRDHTAATDLIYNEPIEGLITRRSASTLVLTEWKMVRNPSDANKKAQEAIQQTIEYEKGLLGGIELKNTRYIVLVSEKKLTLPQDIKIHEVEYRHINIVVDSDSPSLVARKSLE